MTYLIYVTPWSEGEVVAHISDKSFAVGTDHTCGGLVKVNSLKELLAIDGLSLRTEEDMQTAITADSAWYPRDPSDVEEYKTYTQMWKDTYMYEVH